jgi:bacteriocin-like protein
MTTSNKDQEKVQSEPKKPVAKGKAELSEEELKKVTGGGKMSQDDWNQKGKMI